MGESQKFIAERFSHSEASAMLECANLAKKFNDVISFAIGDPDLDTPLMDIDQGVEYMKSHHYYHYGNPLGLQEFREEVVKEYRDDFSITLGLDNVMINSSATHGMMLALTATINPDDEVLLLSPYFTPYKQQVEMVHGKVVEVPLSPDNGWQINLDVLERYITPKTKGLILNTPQNPLGVCLTAESLAKIAKFAEIHDLIIYADEIYTIYSYEHPFIPLISFNGMLKRTITIRSCSKDYCMTGSRIGYTIADSELIEKMNEVNESYIYTAPMMSQCIGLMALRNRALTRKGIREEFYKRMNVCYDRIKKIPVLNALKPQGSFYIFMDIRKTGLNSLDFTKMLLERYHLLVLPGDSFGQGGEGFVRMAITLNTDKINEAFDRIDRDPFWIK